MGKILDWKKNRYDPWKEEKYKPWKEEKYKPWKEQKKEQFKKFGQKVNEKAKNYKENRRRADKRIINDQSVTIKIGNIENMHIGNKLVYNVNKLPNKAQNKNLNEN